jgi:hypothetical protein
MQKLISSFDRVWLISAAFRTPCVPVRGTCRRRTSHPRIFNCFARRGVGHDDTSAANTLAGQQHLPPQESALCAQLPVDMTEALLAAKRVTSLGI